MVYLLEELTNFLGYLGDNIVITEEGLNEYDRKQVRKPKLNPKKIKNILRRLLSIVTDTYDQTTTTRDLPDDIMTKINSLHENYKSSSPVHQQELRQYIEEMLEEDDDQNGGFTRKHKVKKSKTKSKSKTRKSKSKKSRNPPSY